MLHLSSLTVDSSNFQPSFSSWMFPAKHFAVRDVAARPGPSVGTALEHRRRQAALPQVGTPTSSKEKWRVLMGQQDTKGKS